MKLEIKKTQFGWKYITDVSESFSFKSAKEAVEAGYKKLLELLPKEETFDFGKGPVPAHRHQKVGGWVANTAHVDSSVYVMPNACVYDNAQVLDYVQIRDNAKVYDHACVSGNVVIRDRAQINGTSIIKGIAEICDDVIFNSVEISREGKITRS